MGLATDGQEIEIFSGSRTCVRQDWQGRHVYRSCTVDDDRNDGPAPTAVRLAQGDDQGQARHRDGQSGRDDRVRQCLGAADPTGDNSDLAHSLSIALGTDQVGQLNGTKAVDVFSFDVSSDDSTIFVTLSGRDAQYYRVYLISPGRQQAAAARPVGTGNAARLIRYPARSEKGTWFVEVTSDGKRVPNGSYTLRVDVKEPALGGAA